MWFYAIPESLVPFGINKSHHNMISSNLLCKITTFAVEITL